MILAWFSCGITSAVACKIALQQYNNVRIVYFEIDSAHDDNARFIKDCENWFGQKIERARSLKYKDQFDVIEKTRYINGPTGARCTSELKRKVRERIEKDGFDHQVFGFEFTKKEINRAVRFKEQHPHTSPLYPLIENKLTKNQCADILLKNGIKLPTMYELGYTNNNCIMCVKGGKAYANLVRKTHPEHFLRMAKIERELNHTCLKDKDGPIFLDELDPNAGRHEKPILPDCGTFCEIEFAHIISDEVQKIMNSPLKKGQLSLF